MRLRLYKRRVVVLPYTPDIDFVVAPETDTLRIEMLTGDVNLNLFDPDARDGDYLKILIQCDGSPRTITFGGPQGAPGSAVLESGVAALYLVYTEAIGAYASIVAP